MSRMGGGERSRRNLLGLAAAAGPALLLRPRAARAKQGGKGNPSDYKLAPDYRDDWALHKTDPDAGATQVPGGIDLFSAGADTELPVVGRGVALWARQPMSGDFRATFHYTRTDALQATTSAGCSTLFYWATVGRVPTDPDWPADVSTWSAYDQSSPTARVEDPTYIARSNGIRVSFNTLNTVLTPDPSNEVRIVAFRNGVSTRILADFPRKIAFPTGETFKITLERQGTFFSLTAEAEDGATVQNTFTNQLIASHVEGWAGFRLQPSRRVRIRNFVMHP